MKTNQNANKKTSIAAFLCIFCAAAFLLIELALTPLYVYVCTDITVSSTPLSFVFDILLKLADIFTFAVCYSVIIYGAVALGTKKAASLFGIYVASTLIRRLLSLGVSFISYGFVDGNDVFNVSVYFSLEIIQALAVLLISILVSRKEWNEPLEFTKAFSKNSPLQVSMLASAAVVSAVKILMRVYYDINYGAPDRISEVLVMIAYYLSDVLVGAVFYVLAWFTVSAILKRRGSDA